MFVCFPRRLKFFQPDFVTQHWQLRRVLISPLLLISRRNRLLGLIRYFHHLRLKMHSAIPIRRFLIHLQMSLDKHLFDKTLVIIADGFVEKMLMVSLFKFPLVKTSGA